MLSAAMAVCVASGHINPLGADTSQQFECEGTPAYMQVGFKWKLFLNREEKGLQKLDKN